MKIKRTFVLVGLLSLFLFGCANLPSVPPNDESYSVTWKNHDGTVLEVEDNIKSGEMPVFKGATPQKVSNEQYDYSFSGWTPTLKPVFQNQVYMAQFEKSSKDYTITWLNHDNSLLYSSKVGYGIVPKYGGELPKRDNYKVDYSYRFIGWSPEIEVVKSNKTYVAQFAEDIRRFTITWVNFDGALLEVDNEAPYGMNPSYKGNSPTKEANSQYYYVFDGWSPDISIVTEDVTYTAIFKEEVRMYTITWKNHDGEVIEVDNNVPYGGEPSYDGDTPTKESNSQYSYVFDGWSPQLSTVIGDTIYTAVFRTEIRTYIITWENYDGEILKVDNDVPYGTKPSYDNDAPTKNSTLQNSYTFEGWSPEPTTVTGNATYTAIFKEEIKYYTVTWKDNDGTILDTDNSLQYGELPIYKWGIPVKEPDAQFSSYVFDGWYPEITSITQDVTYTAKYVTTDQNYTVIWRNDDGELLETDYGVKYGEMPIYNGETPKSSRLRRFMNWSPMVTNVVGNVTYTAVFEEYNSTYEFGYYPQTKVSNPTLLTKLNAKSGTIPSSSNSGLWTPYRAYIEGANTIPFMWYTDVEEGGEYYRGLYFTLYLVYDSNSASSSEGYQASSGYYTNNRYWFKYEPIEWDVLSVNETDGVLMLSKYALDTQLFYDEVVFDPPDQIAHFKINYRDSDVRNWLNNDFLNMAFTSSQQAMINTTNVDNSATSTSDKDNLAATENTNDKIFLLSFKEVTNDYYGFKSWDNAFSGSDNNDTARQKEATDYAKASGVYVYTPGGYSDWLLRSPGSSFLGTIEFVKNTGEIPNGYIRRNHRGIVPALHINF